MQHRNGFSWKDNAIFGPNLFSYVLSATSYIHQLLLMHPFPQLSLYTFVLLLIPFVGCNKEEKNAAKLRNGELSLCKVPNLLCLRDQPWHVL